MSSKFDIGQKWNRDRRSCVPTWSSCEEGGNPQNNVQVENRPKSIWKFLRNSFFLRIILLLHWKQLSEFMNTKNFISWTENNERILVGWHISNYLNYFYDPLNSSRSLNVNQLKSTNKGLLNCDTVFPLQHTWPKKKYILENSTFNRNIILIVIKKTFKRYTEKKNHLKQIDSLFKIKKLKIWIDSLT